MPRFKVTAEAELQATDADEAFETAGGLLADVDAPDELVMTVAATDVEEVETPEWVRTGLERRASEPRVEGQSAVTGTVLLALNDDEQFAVPARTASLIYLLADDLGAEVKTVVAGLRKQLRSQPRSPNG